MLRSGVGALHDGRDLFVLDLNLIITVLTNVIMDLQLDNEMRQIKGSNFEAYVTERLRLDCPNVDMPINPCLGLKRKGEHTAFAEADAFEPGSAFYQGILS